MARPLRIQYEGAIYHVMNRGDRREDIFVDDGDRWMFLKALGETCARADWQIHAYCLMSNHFHLVVETPSPTLVDGMKWFLGTFTQRTNARHRLRGHLFAGRYRALMVDESDNFYLRTVCDYVHLNPVRAKLIAPDQPVSSFAWSSLPGYLMHPQKRYGWLRTDRLLGEHGIFSDDARGRREFARRMEARRGERNDPKVDSSIRRGWKFGGEDFIDRLRDRMTPAVKDVHEPEMVRESMRVRGQRILAEELNQAQITEADLEKLPKGAAIKIRIARRLRSSTTLTLKEVADLLHAGNWRSLANALAKASSPNVSI